MDATSSWSLRASRRPADGEGGVRVAQILATLLAESAQWIHRMTSDQFVQFGKGLVRSEKGIDDRSDDRLGRLDDCGTRQNPHSAYQSIDADERRNLRLVVRQGVGE